MRILGLDPGSQRTGFGLIDRSGSRLRSVSFGVIACPRAPLPERLGFLGRELEALVEQHAPDVAVLESLFHGINSRSLIVLAQARGGLVTTLARAELPIAEYSPAEVKSAVAGNGRADKTQVARMVKMILGLQGAAIAVDASDALAVAICYAQRFRVDQLRDHSERRTGTAKQSKHPL